MCYCARRALLDVKALEELFVETTLALLLSLPVRSVKTQLAHWYTQKTKRSLTTAVLRALVPKTITVPQAKLCTTVVQPGISYQTLQDSFAVLLLLTSGKRSQTGVRSQREARGPDPNLR